jgi:hypothetical protein
VGSLCQFRPLFRCQVSHEAVEQQIDDFSLPLTDLDRFLFEMPPERGVFCRGFAFAI